MKDKRDKKTANLLASPVAIRQARYADRMREKGYNQYKVWVTDDERAVLVECLDRLRDGEYPLKKTRRKAK